MRRIVNPIIAVKGEGCRRVITGALFGPGIDSPHLAAMQYSCPDLPVFVRHRFVEISHRAGSSRGPMFYDAARLGIELDQSAVSTAEPGISIRVKSSSLGSCHVSARVQIQYPFSRPHIEKLCCIAVPSRPASCPEVTVRGVHVLIAGTGLKRVLLQDLTCFGIKLLHVTSLISPDEAIRYQTKIAETAHEVRIYGHLRNLFRS